MVRVRIVNGGCVFNNYDQMAHYLLGSSGFHMWNMGQLPAGLETWASLNGTRARALLGLT